MRHPRAVLAAILAVSLCAAAALVRVEPPGFRIELDPSSEPLFPDDAQLRETYRRAVLDFGDDELYVIAMQVDDVFTRANLEALRRVARAVVHLPGVRSTDSLVDAWTLRHDARSGLLEIRPLVEEIPAAPGALAELRARALANPLLRGTLVAADGRTAAIQVRFREWSDLALVRADVDGRIRALLARETTSGRRFFVAGRPHVRAAVYHQMVRDLRLLMPLAVCVMALLLWVVTGSLRGVAIPLGTVGIATLWTFGAMAALGARLNVMTVVLGPILIAVGGVYGVHVLAHQEAAAAGASGPVEAARRLLRTTRLPVAIAGASTVVGFGALGLTDVPAARELGGFAVLGVAAVTLLSLTGLPALVALLPLRARADSPRALGIGRRLDGALEGLTRLATRRAGLWLGLWGALALGALALLPRIEVDTDYLSLFASDSRLRRDLEVVNESLAGAIPLYVVLSGEGSGAFREPRNLQTLEQVQRAVEQVAGVRQTLSVVDLVRLTNRAIRQDDPEQARIPDTRGEVAELMLLIPKPGLRPLANVDQSRANLLVRTGELGSAAVRDLAQGLRRAVDGAIGPDLGAEITGDTLLVNYSADGIARSQVRTVGVTALAVFALVGATFRSLPLALVALIPNVVPVLLFYGLLGAGLAPLSLPTSLIGSVALGIAVDDTAHFLVRYRRARAAGMTPEAAALDCGRHVGRPIAITSAMLLAGFMVIALSGFETLRQFGLLTAGTLLLCLLTDLVLLPAVLVRARV